MYIIALPQGMTPVPIGDSESISRSVVAKEFISISFSFLQTFYKNNKITNFPRCEVVRYIHHLLPTLKCIQKIQNMEIKHEGFAN